VVGDGGDDGAGVVRVVACSGGSNGLASTVTTSPMGQVRVLGFRGDCSHPIIEEVGGGTADHRGGRKRGRATAIPSVGGGTASAVGGWPVTGGARWRGRLAHIGGRPMELEGRSARRIKAGGHALALSHDGPHENLLQQ
jgi:hypothetical protein